ncbi:MAG: bifunctional folylpolyglutamate synthase/dihydrofolate synthase [Chloroflexi bacterium]|nr:bifunctional folylpolyglutamate synthase/dihydrofolate synthase [Chloroflexota bacterium]
MPIMGQPLTPAYQQAVDFLYRFLPNSRVRHPERGGRNVLRRMERLLAALNDPHRGYPVLHIAGTNGKGSVAAMTASVLQAAGYRVGLYTSPHLVEFVERIRINGVPIAPDEVAEGVARLRPWTEREPDVSTFELTTALAFDYFARQGVEFAVVEVGLGGRYDATNVVSPEVSVITALDYDHTRLLGPTLADIAYAKAGIIKPERPAVSAGQAPEALAVLADEARRQRAPLYLAPREVGVQVLSDTLRGQHLRLHLKHNGAQPLEVHLPLLGPYQRENTAVAYLALHLLARRGWKVDRAALQRGLEQVRWPCRFEVLAYEPPLVVDGAHTLAAIRALRAGMNHYFPQRPWVLIFGVSRTKDPRALLRALAPPGTQIVATQSIHPKALPADEVAAAARSLGFQVRTAPTVEQALAVAQEQARAEHVLLATGSLFVAAGVRVVYTGEPWWRASLV